MLERIVPPHVANHTYAMISTIMRFEVTVDDRFLDAPDLDVILEKIQNVATGE